MIDEEYNGVTYLYSRQFAGMALEQSLSSLDDTQMAKQNAMNSVLQRGKDGLGKLKSGISSTMAKVGLVSVLSLTAPQAFSQTGNDVAKNTNKPKIANTIPTEKKDTLTTNEVPQWRKDLDSANLNKINFMTANFKQYNDDINKLSADEMQKLVIKQQDIDKYSGTISNLIKILEEKGQFNEQQQKAIKGIQQKLTVWSTEGLHPYLDKLAYYTLQQINVFVATFEQPLIVKQ